MVHPGMILAGKFQVERVLGQGGMGCVVSAFHLQLGQRVAIKFLLPEALKMREAVERFLREARAAVRLRSEHVGRVIDVGQFDDGAPYMVMEYLDGLDLSQYLARSGPMPVVQAVDFVLQACEAIGEAHSLGIVHRDLKPANLFLTRRADGSPLVKVLDFGISKAAEADVSFNLTRTSSVMGSPGYMSPEQLRSSKDCDARSDVWALGVILYELTCGRQPFAAESITELALKVAIDPTPPMHLPGEPPGFEATVARCLGKDPPDRYQNIAELAVALAPYGPPGSHDSALRVSRVLQVTVAPRIGYANTINTGGGGGKPTTLGSSAGTFGTRGGAGKKSRAGVIVGALLAVAAVAGVVVAISMSSKKDDDKGAAAPTPSQDPTPTPAVAVDAAAAAVVVPPPATIDAGAAIAVEAVPDAGTIAAVEPVPEVKPDGDKPKGKAKPKGKRKPKGSGSDEDLSGSRF